MSEYVVPKKASTVVIMRPAVNGTDSPFEVLMVERHSSSVFVPDCYVFPGGVIDAEDCSDESASFCRGLDRQKAFKILGDMPTEAMALGAWVAAARETYEEAGILFSADSPDPDILAGHRRQLLDGKAGFTDILKKEKWTLAMNRLLYFAHWTTPELSPHRYDVRFFVTFAPEDQEATHDGIELTGNTWITPRRALAEYECDRFKMVLPTIMTLRDLDRFDSIEAVMAATAAKTVPSILTTIEERDGRLCEVMPDGKNFSPCL
ncbi:MAG: hypothetical protein JXA41_11520 [Deltaproteobacteria bacterium]|nr:hypothetical protein [Deltaproteobacteria bacterium]